MINAERKLNKLLKWLDEEIYGAEGLLKSEIKGLVEANSFEDIITTKMQIDYTGGRIKSLKKVKSRIKK